MVTSIGRLSHCGAMVRVFVAVMLALAILAARGHAQQTIYSDIYSQQDYQDGPVTVWGIGATDDTIHGVQHNATSQSTLWGPNGSPNSQVTAAGYVSALVSLSAVEGSYQTTSNHWVSCFEGLLGSTSTSTGLVGSRNTNYILEERRPSTCFWMLYCPNGNTSATCNGSPGRGSYYIETNQGEGGVCLNYFLATYLTWTYGGTVRCFPVGTGSMATFARNCT